MSSTLESKLPSLFSSKDDPRFGDVVIPRKIDELAQLSASAAPSASSASSSASSSSSAPSASPLHVTLLGFPYDEGTVRNGGRGGAKDGPDVVRGFIQKLGTVVNPEYDADVTKIAMSDVGNVDASLSLEEAHTQLADMVHKILKAGAIPFVIGGSNDQSYANADGLMKSLNLSGQAGEIGVINIDAHLDVRPLKDGKVHSGSPFRLLLEDKRFAGGKFVEFAAQGSQCSVVHSDYVKSKGGMIYWLQKLRNSGDGSVTKKFAEVLNSLGDNVFVSFDIDSISGADCPGVSCPGTVGLTSQEALTMCYTAGLHPKVRMMDVSEFNPKVEDYRTGRLVANMFIHFAMGLAHRQEHKRI